ncbi:MAG: M50 family metallopeptidase [Oscillospiraceae bacterium]
MYIILGILIFGILIATHELGHFTVAKLFKVKVSEFAIGMGPAIIKKQKGETLYAWRAVPIGGYCAMEEDEESDDPRAFTNQVWWKRMLILIAGAAMNFIFGFIVLMFLVPGSASFSAPVLSGFEAGCPYEGEQGLMVGDEFYEIDGHRIYFTSNISFFLNRSEDTRYDLILLRNGEKLELKDFDLSPVEYELDGQTVTKIGIYMGGSEETGFGTVLSRAWDASKDFTRLVWLGLSDLLTGAVGLKELSGPVGIVEIINDVGESAATTTGAMMGIAYLAAFIAINLAVMNMLPIPALDGGRVLFLLVTAAYEGLTRRRLNPKYEGYVHTAGFVLLLGLMAIVMLNDIYKLFK